MSSTPEEGTVRLCEQAPRRIVPVLRPYRTPSDVGSWTTDASLVPYVEERLKRGIYKGIGEFHPSAAPAGDPVVKAFVALAARQGLFRHAHTEAAEIEKLVCRYPTVRWLWAHAGLGEPFEAVARVMARNPVLVAELSLKSEVSTGRTIDPRWRDILQQRDPGKTPEDVRGGLIRYRGVR